jgi:subtilisin family serine protease
MSKYTPNDELFREQWALERLRAPSAWDRVGPTPPIVDVAIIDSGVADGHEDLPRPWTAHSEVYNDTRDDEDHGTLIAGTVGAFRDNRGGIAGIANIRIHSFKFCSAQVLPSANRAAKAIAEAAKLVQPPQVIVLAWDAGYNTNELTDAIADVEDVSVVVTAAGNHSLDNDKYPNWPANHGKDMRHVITVMATDECDERASFSNYGKATVHLAAPGFGYGKRPPRVGASGFRPTFHVLSTVPYYGPPCPGASYWRGYGSYRGTSASAAHVAGLAALVCARHPQWKPHEVKSHILQTVRQVNGLRKFCSTGGVADFDAAVQ